MFIIVVLVILMSVYVAQNKKLKDSTKTGWFVFISILGGLSILFKIL